MPSKNSPPYPIFIQLGNQIRDKWYRIDEQTRHGIAATTRSRLMQSRNQFEAFVKDIDLYHTNEPQPVRQPKRRRLHEADPDTRNDIRCMLGDLDGALATIIYLFESLESTGMTAGAGGYSLPFGTIAGCLMDRIDNAVDCLREWASDFQKDWSKRVAIPEERLKPTRSSRSLREWLRDIKHRLSS